MFRQITYNTLISFSARIVAVILGFFSLALTTRLLGQEGFGLYATALTWGYIISFVADLGLYSLLVREIGRASGSQEERIVSHIFTLRLFSLLLFFVLGIGVALLSPFRFGLSLVAIILASLQYFFLSLSQLFMAVFQKYLKMGAAAIAEIAGRSLTLLGIAYLFFVTPDKGSYQAILVFFAIGAAVIFAINFFWARKLISFQLDFDYSSWRYFLSQTFPIALSIIFTALYFKLDTLFIAYFRGQQEVGLYNAAYKLLENMIFFPAMFIGMLMPQLSRAAFTQRETFTRIFQGAFDVLLLFALPLALGIAFESEAIMEIIAGREFLASSTVLTILSFGMLMIFFGSLFSNALLALNLQKSLALIYFFGAVFNIGLNLFIIPRWGYIGAGVTTLFTEALVTVLMIQKIERFIITRVQFRRLVPVLAASGVMSLFLLLTHLPLWWSVAGGLLLYGGILWLSAGVTKKDIDLIFEREREVEKY